MEINFDRMVTFLTLTENINELFRSYVLFAYLFSGVHALNAISRRSAHVKVGFHFPLTTHAIVCLL